MSKDFQGGVSARPIIDRDALRPMQVGETVTVFCFDSDANDGFFIKGRAVIVAASFGAHFYRVRFIGDPRVRVRFVHPAYQKNPIQTLAWLRELWRASQTELIDEFFPANDEQGV